VKNVQKILFPTDFPRRQILNSVVLQYPGIQEIILLHVIRQSVVQGRSDGESLAVQTAEVYSGKQKLSLILSPGYPVVMLEETASTDYYRLNSEKAEEHRASLIVIHATSRHHDKVCSRSVSQVLCV